VEWHSDRRRARVVAISVSGDAHERPLAQGLVEEVALLVAEASGAADERDLDGALPRPIELAQEDRLPAA
jgi:hypothetical protein